MVSTGDKANNGQGVTLQYLQILRRNMTIITPTTRHEQLAYGKLRQRFQRLAGLADSQEGGKRDGHRLPRLQLCLEQSS